MVNIFLLNLIISEFCDCVKDIKVFFLVNILIRWIENGFFVNFLNLINLEFSINLNVF